MSPDLLHILCQVFSMVLLMLEWGGELTLVVMVVVVVFCHGRLAVPH